jgi:hypothetical protein
MFTILFSTLSCICLQYISQYFLDIHIANLIENRENYATVDA